MNILTNKTAIITGASSGIGYATAALFARQGANVIVAARRQDELNQLVHEIVSEGGDAVAIPTDVTSEKEVSHMVEQAQDIYGSIDIAFNNAGTLGDMKSLPDLSREEWDDLLAVNLTSCFLCAKHQLPALLEAEGSLIFTSSFVGNTVGMPMMPAYAATKAGLVGLTKSLASEYGSHGLRVNALLPGGTDTPMAGEFGDSPETVQYVESLHALKRRAIPEEIAHAALFLASDMSSFVTGTALLVDGGVSVHRS